MRNFGNTIWNKRVPQYLGAFVLFFSIMAIFWLSQNAVLLGTKAAAGREPKNIKVSNITDSSFTVSYLTNDSVLGTVSYGSTQTLGSLALDDLDQIAGKPFPHRAHHITISKLNPSTRYYFSVTSADQTFSDNEAPYEVMTAPTISASPSAQAPLAGKLVLNNGSPPSEALIYIMSDNAQLLSTLAKPDGTYLLPLNLWLASDLSGSVTLSPSDKLSIIAAVPQTQSVALIQADQTNSVPLITLSNNYDFSITNLPLSQNTISSSSSGSLTPTQVESLPLDPDTTTVSSPIILTPKKDEKFQDSKPQFKGKALPNQTVDIIIESEEVISTTVKTDEYGNWSFRPATPLDPGNHKITIRSLDASGILQTISESFTVHAQGTQFTVPSVSPIGDTSPATTASTSSSPTPTINPTATATPVPTVIATMPPTPSIYITSGPTITMAPLPPSGNSSAILAIIIASLSLGLGGILFFLAF